MSKRGKRRGRKPTLGSAKASRRIRLPGLMPPGEQHPEGAKGDPRGYPILPGHERIRAETDPVLEATARAYGHTLESLAGLRDKVRLADKSELLGGTADTSASFPNWQYISTETGDKLGTPVPFSRVAEDMVTSAKWKMAEESRRAHATGSRPIFTEEPLVRHDKGVPFRYDSNLDPETASRAKAEFFEWLDGPIVLEKVPHSIAHRITPSDLPIEAHILLVNHDWARLMRNSDTSGPEGKGEVSLPYPITVFEFFFKGGVHAVCVAIQLDPAKDDNIHASTHFKTRSGWLKAEVEVTYNERGELQAPSGFNPSNPLMKVYDIITMNVFAISAMLDAQIAEATPIRADYKRNIERPEGAPLPKLSHHVVNLAHRHRVSRAPYPSDEHHRSPRLHFRRGHWRHYSNHKTWIKWTLVGDPELGWIEKEYSL